MLNGVMIRVAEKTNLRRHYCHRVSYIKEGIDDMVERAEIFFIIVLTFGDLAQPYLTFAGWRLGALMVTMKASACGTSQRLD